MCMHVTFIQEPDVDIQEVNKGMEIFKLEKELDEQARSFTNTLNEKDDEILKVHMCIEPFHTHAHTYSAHIVCTHAHPYMHIHIRTYVHYTHRCTYRVQKKESKFLYTQNQNF